MELGAALFTLAIIITFFILIWYTSRELNRKDIKRREAEDQLKLVNKELEAFSYSVAHDLRTPLRALNGFGQVLEEDFSESLDPEGKRMLSLIRKNASKMGALIDDLLAFSRLGRQSLHKVEINMHHLIEEVRKEINKSTNNQAEIIIGKLDPLIGDYNLFYQVMINLLSNAIKYSSKKEKSIVKIESNHVNGEIIYCVADNGAGFNMDYAHKLFGVFQRVHNDNEFEGTGVGLAIVQKMIDKHNGRVWAEGEEGKGAKFYFTVGN